MAERNPRAEQFDVQGIDRIITIRQGEGHPLQHFGPAMAPRDNK